MDKLATIRTFCSVARSGSFSLASRELDVSTAMVSKSVKQLEEDLGVRLLNRSTRHCSLTEAGVEYFNRCQQLLADLDDADSSIRNLTGEVRGTLKISAPATLGTLYLVPALLAFKERYPKVAFNLRLAPQMPDLLEGGFDLAIHAGGTRLDDSEVVARRLGSFRLAICAAPAYLERHGTPRQPQDLERHNCLIFHNETATDTWVFRHGEGEVAVKVAGDLHSNQGAALRYASIKALGVVRLPDYLVRDDVAKGRLVELLADYRSPPRAVFAIYPHRRLTPAKLGTFVDFLVERFQREQELDAADAIPGRALR
ncbi:MAG: LysR substrate-binding domain-containing protein [Gammaproteobacteria bacterium]